MIEGWSALQFESRALAQPPIEGTGSALRSGPESRRGKEWGEITAQPNEGLWLGRDFPFSQRAVRRPNARRCRPRHPPCTVACHLAVSAWLGSCGGSSTSSSTEESPARGTGAFVYADDAE